MPLIKLSGQRLQRFRLGLSQHFFLGFGLARAISFVFRWLGFFFAGVMVFLWVVKKFSTSHYLSFRRFKRRFIEILNSYEWKAK